MIERIYIPTIRRCNTQITFENLPKELQQKVVMVIESSEKSLYNYDCDYLEIPDSIVGSWTQLSQTRKLIHQHAGKIKYAMLDDDMVVHKRNTKYFNGISDMEKSKRKAFPEEIIRLYETASQWLDKDDIGIVGLSKNYLPPTDTEYSDTKGVYSYIFLDGKKISNVVDKIDDSTRVAEDMLFLFTCLDNGINSRMSNEFMYFNMSETKLKNNRPLWNDMFNDVPKNVFHTDKHYEVIKYIKSIFPHAITIHEKDGLMKHTVHWKKLYRPKNQSSLMSFFDE